MFRAEHAWPGLGSCCARPHVRVDGDALNKAIALAGILLKKPVLPDQPTDISRVVLDDVGYQSCPTSQPTYPGSCSTMSGIGTPRYLPRGMTAQGCCCRTANRTGIRAKRHPPSSSRHKTL